MKDLITFIDKRMLNNTYLLLQDNNALIIDPSFDNEELIDYVKKNDVNIKAILLSHGHYDHFAGVEKLGKLYSCPYYISEGDEDYLYDRSKSYAINLPSYKPMLYPADFFSVAGFELTIINCPGHTPGSVVIIWKNKMFSGDFIFYGDIGRTDLKGGSPVRMEESLKEFAKIQGEYEIYPGHEESTTLAQEKKHNLYLNRYI